ncbi:MAG: HlyC/CorC family transporter [Pseudomonadota bacterium]|nr:HlyC/CorC family transporter [Pseudomonadota bacterium]
MSEDVPLGLLTGVLFFLIILSACFSGSETALIALNRYKLRHKSRLGHRGARYAEKLLKRPDRLITLILFGNNLVNFTAAALASYLTLNLFGASAWISAIGTFVFTVIVLIFAEVIPKTLAALHPERLAFPASYVYIVLQKIALPITSLINLVSNTFLRLFGVNPEDISEHDSLTIEELSVIVKESAKKLPRKRHRMLQGILELEEILVDDIMLPHNEISGLNLDLPWEDIIKTIKRSEYTRLPVYRDNIDEIIGILNLRRLIQASALGQQSKESLIELIDEPYFIPEGTTLHHQLLQFQRSRQRSALVVDEYGDIQGLITLEDILEEIVGELSNDGLPIHADVEPEKPNGSFLVNANANVRALNRTMNWTLPTHEGTTLNGLILEQLETIPTTGTTLTVGDYNLEIIQTSENLINKVRVKTLRQEKITAVV